MGLGRRGGQRRGTTKSKNRETEEGKKTGVIKARWIVRRAEEESKGETGSV